MSAEETWCLPTCQELAHEFIVKVDDHNEVSYLSRLDAVEVLSLACRTDALAVKDANQGMFNSGGRYCGAKNIITALQEDKAMMKLPDERVFNVSRWVYVAVNQLEVSKDFDLQAQEFMTHGDVQIKHSEDDVMKPSGDFSDEPIIVVRTYVCPETAPVNYMCQTKYGHHRCNLAIDAVMGTGVYAYTDIVSVLNRMNHKDGKALRDWCA